MNQFQQQMICEDCSFPPNFITNVKPNCAGKMMSCTTCRDCGEYWEEPFDADDFFSEDNDTDTGEA